MHFERKKKSSFVKYNMETLWIEMPTKLSPNSAIFQTFIQMYHRINALEKGILKISFKKTRFIQPTLISFLGFLIYQAKEKENQVRLVGVSDEIKNLLEHYELLKKEKKPLLINILPFRIFEITEIDNFEEYLKKNVLIKHSMNELNYIMAYLKEIFHVLDSKIICSGFHNLNEDWLFFTMISLKVTLLNHAIFHLLLEELQQTNGKLWIIQEHIYRDLKENRFLNQPFPHTLIIIGFRLI